jgi:dTDP-4-dehydrorhamnose 3,5-epimerase
MFHEGPIDGLLLRPIARFGDARGWLIELFREDQLPAGHLPAMAYLSETLPGVVRGPHEHREQSDYFAFVGPGDFMLYLWDPRTGSPTHGNRWKAVVGQSNMRAVLVPPRVVHAYRNVSDLPGLVINCPDRLYAGRGRSQPVDEIRYEDRPDSPYQID